MTPKPVIPEQTDFDTQLAVVDKHYLRAQAERLRNACSAVAAARKFATAATELDQVFEPLGHAVSTGTLHNTLGDHERNYARLEWLPYFATLSYDVVEIVAECHGLVLAQPRKLKPEDELEILRDRVKREFGNAGARLVASVAVRR